MPNHTADVSPGESPADGGQLLLEVNRTFLYFNQMQRDKQVSGLVIGSMSATPADWEGYFAEKLQIPVTMFDPSARVVSADGDKDAAAGRRTLKSLPVLLGLLVESAALLNLLPERVREHKRRLAGVVVVVLAIVAVSVALGFGYIGLRWARGTLRQAVAAERRGVLQLKPKFEESKKIEAERRRRDFQVSIPQRFERAAPLWRGVFYELSRLTPPGLSLSSLALEERDERWRFEAEGVIRARTSAAAQETLKNFLRRLRGAVFFSRPQVLAVNIAPYGPAGRGARGESAGGRDLLRSQLKFGLSGYLRR